MNRYAVTTTNYLAACTVSLLMLVASPPNWPNHLDLGAGLADVLAAIRTNTPLTSQNSNTVWAILSGAAAGTFFFLGFIYYQLAVRRHGVSLAGAFIKLGVLVPMSLSLLLWHEAPNTVQWLGIMLAIFSMLIVNWPAQGSWRSAIKMTLLLLCLFGGTSDFSNKVFQQYATGAYRSLFLLVTFSTALVCSIAATVRMNRVVRRRDVVTGLAVGVPNQLSAYFLILALERMPAAIVYPAVGAGSILFITLGGAIGFGERLERRDIAAICLIAGALILINAG